MGNISSVIGRGDASAEADGSVVGQDEEFISEAVAGLELNHHDYQVTLHQYLSQRYAERYTNTNYEYIQQRLRTHQTSTNTSTTSTANTSTAANTANTSTEQLNQQVKEPLSRNSSFNQSGDLIVLSLKGKKLKEVPLELFYHDEVTSLDLSNNEFTILPKGFKKLNKLTRLALGGNQIIALPEEISTLKEMTWLDFTNNRISEIPSSFASMKKLTSLGASDCRFSEFPPVICQMKNIRKLGIFNNLFTSLPKEIGNLRLLTKLDLSGNALKHLPEEIGQLTELNWLNLSQNQLESIPKSMAKLTKLKELGLAHNKLKRLPDLSSLTELTLLPVYNNELEELGDWIGNLKELNKLDLSCNQLKTVPATILLPPKLNFINLRKNRLQEFSDKMLDKRINVMVQVPLPMELCTIDVRENELEYLPLALIGPSLIELKTSYNPWKLKEPIEDDGPITVPIQVPSLLDLVCAQMIQTPTLRPLIATTTFPIQIHILQKTHRCQYCEKPATDKGIDCMLWRATTDSSEVPFRANVCGKTCLKALDATPI